jgi:hypothetical protein
VSDARSNVGAGDEFFSELVQPYDLSAVHRCPRLRRNSAACSYECDIPPHRLQCTRVARRRHFAKSKVSASNSEAGRSNAAARGIGRHANVTSGASQARPHHTRVAAEAPASLLS